MTATPRDNLADWSAVNPTDLLEGFYGTLAPNSARAYASDLRAFATFLHVDGPRAAAQHFLNLPRGTARLTLDRWAGYGRREGWSLNTVRRRVQSILALARRAQDYDVIPWSIRKPMPTPRPARDTRGPGRPAIEQMIATSRQRGDAKGYRDEAMLDLLFYSALRAGEILTLDVKHVDTLRREVRILPKGQWQRLSMPIPTATTEAIDRLIEARGGEDGPLLTSMDRSTAAQGERLSYAGLHKTIATLGESVGVRCTPHGLRHTASTELARLTNGNLNLGLALTRHADPKTLLMYNDVSRNRSRDAVEILAANYPIRHGDNVGIDNQ